MVKQICTYSATGHVPGLQSERFYAWLVARCRRQIAKFGAPIVNERAVRTSTETVTLWQASAVTSFAAADRSDPDVAAALVLGFDLVRRDAIGETTRAALGDAVFVVRLHHATGGVGGRQLGIVIHVGHTFFIYLLSSARAGNLDAETDDRRGNAVTEVISMVTRAMWQVGRMHDGAYRPHLHAREHDRIVRDERHGAALKETLRVCHAVAHTPHTTDMIKPSEAQHFSFGSMMSAGAADSAIRGMNRSEIVIQAGGGFYENIAAAPFTHGALVLVERDGRTGTDVMSSDKHRLAVVRDVDLARGQLRALVDEVLREVPNRITGRPLTDWFAVGRLMAEMGLPSRLPRHLKRHLLLRDLPVETQARAAKSLFGRRWVSGWQTGSFKKLVPIKIVMDLDLSDLGVEEVLTSDGRPAYKCEISMPLPEGGWGVTDAEWAEVLMRRYPESGRPRRYTGTILPLIGLCSWTDDERATQFKVTSKQGYILRSRPLVEGQHKDGTPRGWPTHRGAGIARMRPSEWHADIGRAMREALESLDCKVAPLTVAGHGAGGTTDPGELDETARTARRTVLAAEIVKATNQRDGALDEGNELKGRIRGREASTDEAREIAEAKGSLERARVRLQAKEAELVALDLVAAEIQASPAVERLVDVRTATAEFVAVALEKCEGGAPGWLHEACGQLLTDMVVTPVTTAGGRPSLAWSATLALPTLGEDGVSEVVTLPIAGEVFDRSNSKKGGAVTVGPEGWAWAFFFKGQSFTEIGAASSVDGSGKKNSYLYKGIEEWLNPVVADVALRAAALDCPIPATRRVLWSAVTGDSLALNGIAVGFADHIRDTYSHQAEIRSWGWCRDTHVLARRAADLMLTAGGSLGLYDLAEQLGVPPAKVLALTRQNGGSTTSGPVKVPALLAVSPFERNWARASQWLAPDERLISLRPCPHADCPERLRGGTPFASHMISSPETQEGHGVLCPSCRRMPTRAFSTVYFPADYLRPWSGRFGSDSHSRARRQTGSHVDVLFSDRGPDPTLPDTGALARPETRINKAGNFVPYAIRALPLQGRRVLAVDLRGDQVAEVTRALADLGGRTAKNVTANLACVVVTDAAGAADPKATKAAEVGVPVLTHAQFMARAFQGWPSDVLDSRA